MFKYFNYKEIEQTTTFENAKAKVEEVKKQYKKLAFKFHPDLTGTDTTKEMQEINEEYQTLLNLIKEQDNDFSIVLSELFILQKEFRFTIEVVGTWLWLKGITYNQTDLHEMIKSYGFLYSKKEKQWYRDEKGTGKKRKGFGSIGESNRKAKFGYEIYEATNDVKGYL